MARKQIRNRIKATIWGERSRMECSGGFDLIPHFIFYVDSPGERQRILAEMFANHQKMLEIESTQGNENGNEESQ